MSGRSLRTLIVAGLVAATATTVLGSPAAARPITGSAESTQLYVDGQSYAVAPGDTFESTIRVEGPAARVAALTAADADIVVEVHEAIADVDQLEGPVGRALDSVVLDADEIMSPVAGGANGTISVPIASGDADDGSLDAGGGGGVHPITIELTAGSDTVTTTTFLEVLDPAAPAQPLSIAIVVAVADSNGFADLVEVATAVDAPLSISVPPALARDLGGDSGAAAPSGDALRFDELVALPAAALDPSAVVAVDESDAFTRMLRDGEDVLSTASPLAAVSRAVWIADEPISGPGAAMLRDLGIRMFVMTDGAASGLGVDPNVNVFAVALGDGELLPAMTIDPLGSQLSAEPANLETANLRAVRLLASLRLARSDGAAPAVVLGVPGLAVPDADVTARLAGLVDALPGTSIVAVSRLPGIAVGTLGEGVAPIALPAVAGADLTARRAEIEAVRDDANHAASMLVDSPLPDGWDRRLDALLASDIDDTTAGGRLSEIDAEIDAVLSAIVAPEPFTLTLTGTANTLRLPIRNTGDEPLRVDVRVRSPKLTTEQPTQQVEVPALSSVEVEVPVEARSQGTFTIEVDVLAPSGHHLGPPVVLKGRVSDISGLSQVVTGGAALILVSWWYTHLRRTRAERRARRAMIQP